MSNSQISHFNEACNQSSNQWPIKYLDFFGNQIQLSNRNHDYQSLERSSGSNTAAMPLAFKASKPSIRLQMHHQQQSLNLPSDLVQIRKLHSNSQKRRNQKANGKNTDSVPKTQNESLKEIRNLDVVPKKDKCIGSSPLSRGNSRASLGSQGFCSNKSRDQAAPMSQQYSASSLVSAQEEEEEICSENDEVISQLFQAKNEKRYLSFARDKKKEGGVAFMHGKTIDRSSDDEKPSVINMNDQFFIKFHLLTNGTDKINSKTRS